MALQAARRRRRRSCKGLRRGGCGRRRIARAYEEVAAGAAGEDGFDAAPSVVALQVLLRASLLQSSSPARLRVPFAHVEMHP
jgi:hypothetical protein